MFPYNHKSSYGYAYTIYDFETQELKKDSIFISRFLRGVELLLLSWGWNLEEQNFIAKPHSAQCWQNWPVRLYKCGMSLKQFGFETEFLSVKKYATFLLEKKIDFSYLGKDLSFVFTR